jgi:hypothetical protein
MQSSDGCVAANSTVRFPAQDQMITRARMMGRGSCEQLVSRGLVLGSIVMAKPERGRRPQVDILHSHSVTPPCREHVPEWCLLKL